MKAKRRLALLQEPRSLSCAAHDWSALFSIILWLSQFVHFDSDHKKGKRQTCVKVCVWFVVIPIFIARFQPYISKSRKYLIFVYDSFASVFERPATLLVPWPRKSPYYKFLFSWSFYQKLVQDNSYFSINDFLSSEVKHSQHTRHRYFIWVKFRLEKI